MKYILCFSLMFVFHACHAASGRYPSNDETQPNKYGNEKCNCDPKNDPCCIPPLGNSSSKSTGSDKTARSDTATCHCDPNTDPCCKQFEGTKLDNSK
jgi:hypothetical protein